MSGSLAGNSKTIKDGSTIQNIGDYQFIQNFTAISKALIDSKSFSESCKIEMESLAIVSSQLQAFMMKAIGVSSPISSRVMTKIPKSCFEDYSSNGSLNSIILVALKYCEEAKWTEFSLDAPERYSDGIAILQAIESKLLQDGKLKRKKFFIQKVAADHIPKLTQQITSHGGIVVETSEEASHILEWDNEIDILPSVIDQNFLKILSSPSNNNNNSDNNNNNGNGNDERGNNNDDKETGMDIERENEKVVSITIAKENSLIKNVPSTEKSFVHWIYYPDSYDEHIDTDDIVTTVKKNDTDTNNCENPINLKNQENEVTIVNIPEVLNLDIKPKWHLNCQFITLCDYFNEWGNENDFELKLNVLNNYDKYVKNTKSNQLAIESEVFDIVNYVKTEAESEKNIKSEVEDIEKDVRTKDIIDDNRSKIALEPIATFSMRKSTSTSLSSPTTTTTTTTTSSSISTTSTDTISIPSNIINIYSGGGGGGNGVGIKRKADGTEENTSVLSVKQKKNSRKSYQSLLKLPIWFKSESVNYLEIRNLPEFFSSNKNNSIHDDKENDEEKNLRTEEYIKIRNFIVNLYSLNPFVYLSATECRKKIAGDVCIILKIHSFLDNFSLINFNVKPDCRPTLPSTSFSTNFTVTPTPSSSSLAIPTPVPTTVPIHGLSDDQSTASTTPLTNTLGSGALINKVQNNPKQTLTQLMVDEDDDKWCGEWTYTMDEILLKMTIETKGSWSVISKKLNEDALMINSDINDIIKPVDCIVRLICLPIVRSSGTNELQGGNIRLPCNSAAQQNLFLSSQIARKGVDALGCEEAQKIVERTLLSSSEEIDMIMISKKFSKQELKIILALGGACISVLASKEAEIEKIRLKSLLNDYISHRLSALEEKMKLLVDVDRMIDIEKERLEVDRRDSQIQRAQLAYQLAGQLGQ